MKRWIEIGAFACVLTTACAAPQRDLPSPLTAGAVEAALDTLRARSDSLQSFFIEGTLLLEWDTQKHFVHFDSWYESPARFRLDCRVGGPLGLGSGTLRYVERDGMAEIVVPDEPPVSGPVGGTQMAAVETGGLSLQDARYGLSPYAGGTDLFVMERLRAHGIEPGSGRYRFTFERADGLDEVVLVDPSPVSLSERRVAKRDGTVLAVMRYEYQKRGDLFAKETESRFPEQESLAKIRYRSVTLNGPIPEDVFAWSNETQ